MPTIIHTPRQKPVAAALDQLLADAEATARAIEDNTHEDGIQIDPMAARIWFVRLERISNAITKASSVPWKSSYLPAFPSAFCR
jgi:hypothetical protein